MARRLCNDNEIVMPIQVRARVVQVTVTMKRVTHVSSNCLEFTDCDPGLNRDFSVQNIEHNAMVP
jgi:hypothetical protein